MSPINSRIVPLLFAALSLAPAASAQSGATSAAQDEGYWGSWFERAEKARAGQPRWITPLATTTPRLEQEFRYDIVRQRRPDGTTTQNYGNGKGLELIPFGKVEVIVGIPPYFIHDRAQAQDGFGDWRLLVKYRLLSANERDGNYIVTAFMDVSLPTGSGANDATNTILTPTIAYGKGFARFDVQGTFGAGVPTGNLSAIGRTYTWNNALQYQLLGKLWPEVEVNASFFRGGRNDDNKQVFVTPGVVFGRIPLSPRLGFAVGIGVQIAATEFRTSKHNAILSVRFPF